MRKFLLVLMPAAIAGSIYYFESQRPMRAGIGAGTEVAVTVPKNLPRAKELVSPEGYINTDKITIAELVGKKVVLVDFWTYSCINCQRTQPYLNAWYDKYRESGLEIIGVHTPEFEFEKEYDNVKKAAAKAGIKYPVVQDNDYATWQAYGNRYWPRKYLIDIDGYIVYDHIGEGAYEETERKIQELLQVSADVSRPGAETVTAGKPLSPEIYFGASRNSRYLGNGMGGQTGVQNFSLPSEIRTSVLYLAGDWHIDGEYAENQNLGNRIVFRYQAKKVYMVASSEQKVSVKIFRDGAEYKTITVQADELYTVVDDDEYGAHTLELVPQSPGFKIYTFTFG